MHVYVAVTAGYSTLMFLLICHVLMYHCKLHLISEINDNNNVLSPPRKARWDISSMFNLRHLQTCMWSSWCHCHSLSFALVKSRQVLPFWYRLTRVVPVKGPLRAQIHKTFKNRILDPLINIPDESSQLQYDYWVCVCVNLNHQVVSRDFLQATWSMITKDTVSWNWKCNCYISFVSSTTLILLLTPWEIVPDLQ